MAYDAQSWQNFYVMVGGAAAALTGLLFVAMSIHAKEIIAHPLLSNRALGTLISLLTQLALAGAVLPDARSGGCDHMSPRVARACGSGWRSSEAPPGSCCFSPRDGV
ncbi:MAG TPA: hypothetical protein VFR68_04550 [Candidatus Dormibacteraeota bacterium]|nr:hypothetical protein [Candidatus Dormibacteraeota bacterium]